MLQATAIAGPINGLHTCVCSGPKCLWPDDKPGTTIEHGYCGDGYNDCYGFVRRVWNPFLAGMTAACRKTAGMGTSTALPVGDAPDSLWAKITDPTMLISGDVLATAQGHAWGNKWHGGLFAGGATSKGFYYYFDDEPSGATSAIKRSTTGWNGFRYYYKPTHYLLQNPCP